MNRSDLKRNSFMLKGALSKRGYDWWWHSFTARKRSTGEEKAFFIEYFIINPAISPDKVVLGQKYRAGSVKPSYVMVKAGTWGKDARQIHNFYPISELVIEDGRLNLEVSECSLNEYNMSGIVAVSEEEAKKHPEYMSDAGVMKWDIDINKRIAFNVGYGASSFFRWINAFEMFWHAEGMKTEYSGIVELDGEIYDVLPESSYGYADKNWGKDFTSPWVWLSSNNMVSKLTGKKLENSVFDIGGGRPKVFFVELDRKLLGSFFYEGKDYEYNFSKPWLRSKIRFSCKETDKQIIWKIRAGNKNSVMELMCRCDKSDMLLVNYESPDGLKLHNRLWNGGNGRGRIRLYDKTEEGLKLVDDILFYNAGCEYGEMDK